MPELSEIKEYLENKGVSGDVAMKMQPNRKPFEKIIYKEGFDFYKHYGNVPIDQLAESLGISLSPSTVGGYKCLCPCPEHDDHSPSTDIKTSGKYENTFICRSCGESGGPIELVMAVQSDITPSEYWSVIKGNNPEAKKEMFKARDDAAKYIETLFPGNLIVRTNGQKNENKNMERPSIPPWIRKEMDFATNPFMTAYVNTVKNEKGEVEKECFGKLSEFEATEMVLDRLLYVSGKLKKDKMEILEKFPGLDLKAKAYIASETANKIEEVEKLRDSFRSYLSYLLDKSPEVKDAWEDYEEVEK